MVPVGEDKHAKHGWHQKQCTWGCRGAGRRTHAPGTPAWAMPTHARLCQLPARAHTCQLRQLLRQLHQAAAQQVQPPQAARQRRQLVWQLQAVEGGVAGKAVDAQILKAQPAGKTGQCPPVPSELSVPD